MVKWFVHFLMAIMTEPKHKPMSSEPGFERFSLWYSTSNKFVSCTVDLKTLFFDSWNTYNKKQQAIEVLSISVWMLKMIKVDGDELKQQKITVINNKPTENNKMEL